MSWRTAATIIIVVFALTGVWVTVADPLVQFGDKLQESGDNSNEHFDGDSLIDGYIGSFFNMILVAIFGLLSWGLWRVLRQELTRGLG